MKNVEIILGQMVELIENGVLTEDNIIDTVPGWNKKGYKVKKGEEHIAAFAIWMPKTKKDKKKIEEEETEEKAEKKKERGFYLKTAYWFSDKQVEKMN